MMQSFVTAKPQSAPNQSARAPAGPRIGPAHDPMEVEADRAADRVVAGKFAGPIARAASSGIRRKCAACEREEHKIQRKEQVSATPTATAAAGGAAADAVRSGGVPLSAADRAYFEPRFGQDFSNVRLHTHSRAASAAAGIHARAYTWQKDIAFAPGEFSPGSLEGRRLIAHELAHVAQRAPHIARQAAPYYTRTFRDDQGGDPLDYTETVQVAPTQGGTGIEGSVDRTVVAPAHGTTPQQTTHTGRVQHIRLTPDCRIIVPYRIQFLPQAQARFGTGICQDPPNATAVSAPSTAQVSAFASRYIGLMNAGLNNRYAARVTGCSSAQPCTNRSMPVEIAAEAVATGADQTIDVVNRGGRANASTICLGSFTDELPVHEGAHQALGAPDEYLEEDPATIASAASGPNPRFWGRPERVRSDLSAMTDQDSYGRFMLFHERHFRFAQVFLEAVMRGQGCTVSLEQTRSAPTEFRLDVGIGAAGTNRGSLMYGSLFVGAGIPLERRRRLIGLIGAYGQALTSAGSQDQRAFMGGLRVGLQAQTTPANLGLSGSVFASGGGLYAPGSNPPTYTGLAPTTERFSPFGEVGANLNFNVPMFSAGWQVRVGAEGALGREFSSDPNALHWWRAGFVIGVSR
jgi:hypothetical protein